MDLKTKICYFYKGCHYKLKRSWFEYALSSSGALNTWSKQISEGSSGKGSLELNIWPPYPNPIGAWNSTTRDSLIWLEALPLLEFSVQAREISGAAKLVSTLGETGWRPLEQCSL